MKNSIKIYGRIERDTEKAVLAKLTWEHPDTIRRKQWSAWLPKSQITINNNSQELSILGDKIIDTPQWLADKIANEIRKHIGMPPTGCSIFNL